MSTATLLAWIHPVAGGVAVALAAQTASLAVRGRRPGPNSAALRRRHAAIMPWVYGLMLANWVIGVVSVEWLREDIETAASGHFNLGSAIIALFTLALIVSRRIPTDPRARKIHPWIGAVALLLCGVQVFLGLQIMPH